MDFGRRWTIFALEAETSDFGVDRIARAHNDAMDSRADALRKAEQRELAALAELDELRAEWARFKPLHAKGVVDADDNLDCWDTSPYEICTRHVAALNERDPAAMWCVVDLFAVRPNVGVEHAHQ